MAEPHAVRLRSCLVAKTLRAHRESILTYLTHRITNAVTEGLNAKIQWVKYSSRGFRDREPFKLAIYLHCGGVDLEPRAEKILSLNALKPEDRQS